MAGKHKFWLMKSEPRAYSINRLRKQGRTPWDGIRNYQARNLMRDEMNVGDLVLFYHSSCSPPGVVGVARVCSEPYPDPTAFKRRSKYYDKKSDPENPTWILVDVEFVEKFDSMVTLEQLKADTKLEGMRVTMRGQRLSVQPVDKKHFKRVLAIAGAETKVT